MNRFGAETVRAAYKALDVLGRRILAAKRVRRMIVSHDCNSSVSINWGLQSTLPFPPGKTKLRHVIHAPGACVCAFRVAFKREIGERRRRKLALLLSPEDAAQFKMTIVVGEYIGSERSPFGRRITVKAHA
jgi:hypothetical protein